jgi:hypothetical protein
VKEPDSLFDATLDSVLVVALNPDNLSYHVAAPREDGIALLQPNRYYCGIYTAVGADAR